mgnify:CR=1 FL=1
MVTDCVTNADHTRIQSAIVRVARSVRPNQPPDMGKHRRDVPDGQSIGARTDSDKKTMEDGHAEGRDKRAGRVTPESRDAARPIGQRRADEETGRHSK